MNPEPRPVPGPLSVVTFRDAIGLAMAVADEYAFANVAALIDERGIVVDMAVTEGIGQSIEPTVAWAATRRPREPAETQRTPPTRRRTAIGVLLVSVRPYEVEVVRELDLQLFRTARWALAGAGLHLLDWIETDGDLFRSYAYVTCPGDAWADDPPSERLSDQQPS